MEAQKVDMYIIANAKYFEGDKMAYIHDRLLAVDDSRWIMIQTLQLKEPQTSLIISILAGHWGIDRFVIGDIGLGIAKLLTCGGMGIWTIIDWFTIQGITREKNFEKLVQILQ